MSVESITETTQYLTFSLDEELYALDISTVQSVLDFDKITKVPRTPDFMRGVINLRGSVVPIVDIKYKFGLSKTEKSVDSCIIIVEMEIDNEVTVLGCLTDSVNEVIDIDPENIEHAPKIGTRLNTEFIKGMAKRDDKFLIILDLNKVFSFEELSLVKDADSSSYLTNENVKSNKVAEKKNEPATAE